MTFEFICHFSMQANADASKYLNWEVMKLQHAFSKNLNICKPTWQAEITLQFFLAGIIWC